MPDAHCLSRIFIITVIITVIVATAIPGQPARPGSWIARRGIPSALYSSAKGAVETLTRAWAAEFGPDGVRVKAISPGVIRAPDPDGSDISGFRVTA